MTTCPRTSSHSGTLCVDGRGVRDVGHGSPPRRLVCLEWNPQLVVTEIVVHST